MGADRSVTIRATARRTDDDRLTADDRRQITRAVKAVWQSWGEPAVLALDLFDALARAGAASIDCWMSDLRDVERAWIYGQCSALLTTEEEKCAWYERADMAHSVASIDLDAGNPDTVVADAARYYVRAERVADSIGHGWPTYRYTGALMNLCDWLAYAYGDVSVIVRTSPLSIIAWQLANTEEEK